MATWRRNGGIRSSEAAGRLGIGEADVGKMLLEGELDGGTGNDGIVYVDEVSVEAYLDRHGFGVVVDADTTSPRLTSRNPRVTDSQGDS